MALDAQGPADRVEQLVLLTESLTRRLAADLAALESHRPHQIAMQGDETARLANLYRRETARVKADPQLLSGASATLHRRLLDATETFEDTLMRFERAVKAATTVTEGLVRVVASEISRQRAPMVAYGPGATTRGRDEKAMAVNRQA